MLIYYLKEKESSKLGSIDLDNNSVKDLKIKSKETNPIDSKSSENKKVPAKSRSKLEKRNSTDSSKLDKIQKSKLSKNADIKKDKNSEIIQNKKEPINPKLKATKGITRPKTYKYSKRFLQIDQELENYSILKGEYYLPNTSKNRAKYPNGLIQDTFIKIKSSKKLSADSVLQNKSSKNFSLFKRVVKFQVKDEMGADLLNDLKGFEFTDINELSMINHKYTLKFKTPEEAFKAYSLIKEKFYLKWSSVDVFEFIKIKE